jgi:hypothetical protein
VVRELYRMYKKPTVQEREKKGGEKNHLKSAVLENIFR